MPLFIRSPSGSTKPAPITLIAAASIKPYGAFRFRYYPKIAAPRYNVSRGGLIVSRTQAPRRKAADNVGRMYCDRRVRHERYAEAGGDRLFCRFDDAGVHRRVRQRRLACEPLQHQPRDAHRPQGHGAMLSTQYPTTASSAERSTPTATAGACQTNRSRNSVSGAVSFSYENTMSKCPLEFAAQPDASTDTTAVHVRAIVGGCIGENRTCLNPRAGRQTG